MGPDWGPAGHHSILGSASLAPQGSIQCTLCGALRLAEGCAAGSRQLTFQLRYSAGS